MIKAHNRFGIITSYSHTQDYNDKRIGYRHKEVSEREQIEIHNCLNCEKSSCTGYCNLVKRK